MKFTRLIIVLLSFTGVASSSFAAENNNVVIELFLVRGFLGGTDYERFYLKDDAMWYECGEISDLPKLEFQPITADKYLPQNARMEVSQRLVAKLNDQRLSEVASQVKQIQSIDFEGKLLPPGSILGLSGAGLVELRIKSADTVKTVTASIDELSEGSGIELEQLRSFIQYVRGSGEVLCGHETFYAIKR